MLIEKTENPALHQFSLKHTHTHTHTHTHFYTKRGNKLFPEGLLKDGYFLWEVTHLDNEL